MPTIVVKNVPEAVHARLKAQAERNHRSVSKELLTLIEASTAPKRVAPTLPPPIKLKGGPLTTEEIEAAINDGRD